MPRFVESADNRKYRMELSQQIATHRRQTRYELYSGKISDKREPVELWLAPDSVSI